MPKAYLFESPAEPLKHPLHVTAFFHGDDAGVVFLIDPYQESFLIVVPAEQGFRIKFRQTTREQTNKWGWKLSVPTRLKRVM